jgi:hypothetical protein
MRQQAPARKHKERDGVGVLGKTLEEIKEGRRPIFVQHEVQVLHAM